MKKSDFSDTTIVVGIIAYFDFFCFLSFNNPLYFFVISVYFFRNQLFADDFFNGALVSKESSELVPQARHF